MFPVGMRCSPRRVRHPCTQEDTRRSRSRLPLRSGQGTGHTRPRRNPQRGMSGSRTCLARRECRPPCRWRPCTMPGRTGNTLLLLTRDLPCSLGDTRTQSPRIRRESSWRCRGCMSRCLSPPCTSQKHTRRTPRSIPPHTPPHPRFGTQHGSSSRPKHCSLRQTWRCRRGTKHTACSRCPCLLSTSPPRTPHTPPHPIRTPSCRHNCRRQSCPLRRLNDQGRQCTTPGQSRQSRCSAHSLRTCHSPTHP
mmetsp:Transcript_65372/g.155936  ORF Transcript_65372/g.155936 Transcript_65372/m.155936 type:complete len:249 (+) Transcript_65372:1323-2069(+)